MRLNRVSTGAEASYSLTPGFLEGLRLVVVNRQLYHGICAHDILWLRSMDGYFVFYILFSYIPVSYMPISYPGK